MKKKAHLYSVINGDIIGSTRLDADQHAFYLTELKNLFDELKKKKKDLGIAKAFEIYRGDSFQGALDKPEVSLKVLLLIRSFIRMTSARYEKKKTRSRKAPASLSSAFDARLVVGIGKITKLETRLLESDGEAFHRSGRLIDSIKKSGQNIAIETPWENLNQELDVFCGLLDSVVSRWSSPQAEVVYLSLKGLNQTQIAALLKTSIPAVNQRLRTANWHSVYKLIVLFETLINKKNG